MPAETGGWSLRPVPGTSLTSPPRPSRCCDTAAVVSPRSIGLIAGFFDGGAGPSHSKIEVIWSSADATDYLPAEGNKSSRVLEGLHALRKGRPSDGLPADPEKLREVTELLLWELFPDGGVNNPRLRLALEQDGLHFSEGLPGIGLTSEDPAPLKAVHESPDAPERDHTAVFLVHGHDARRLRDVEKLLERLVDEVIVLADQPNRGQTVVEKFLNKAGQASMAVVLLTGDDEGRKVGEPELVRRGRQNVIFEMGFFFASLGRDRVVVLHEPGVELPSDVAGLLYVSFEDQWAEALRNELAAAGIRAKKDY